MKRGGRINPVSKRRRENGPRRDLVRKIVAERAGHTCWYAPVIPEIRCRWLDRTRPELEVDELRGGSYRSTEMYDPDACRLTCQSHHDHKTEHKLDVLDRLARYEQEHPWPNLPALPSDPSCDAP